MMHAYRKAIDLPALLGRTIFGRSLPPHTTDDYEVRKLHEGLATQQITYKFSAARPLI